MLFYFYFSTIWQWIVRRTVIVSSSDLVVQCGRGRKFLKRFVAAKRLIEKDHPVTAAEIKDFRLANDFLGEYVKVLLVTFPKYYPGSDQARQAAPLWLCTRLSKFFDPGEWTLDH